MLCKKLEFKNLLSRFSVDAPKNSAEEHFRRITDEKEACRFLESAKGRACGFYFVLPEERQTETRAGVQMSLFDGTSSEAARAGRRKRFSWDRSGVK